MQKASIRVSWSRWIHGLRHQLSQGWLQRQKCCFCLRPGALICSAPVDVASHVAIDSGRRLLAALLGVVLWTLWPQRATKLAVTRVAVPL